MPDSLIPTTWEPFPESGLRLLLPLTRVSVAYQGVIPTILMWLFHVTVPASSHEVSRLGSSPRQQPLQVMKSGWSERKCDRETEHQPCCFNTLHFILSTSPL